MATEDWDAYWRNAESAAAHKDGGPQDEVLERFWLQFFQRTLPAFRSRLSMLDIACGNGAVPRHALAAIRGMDKDVDVTIYGLDESPAALGEMRKRNQGLCYIAANAASLPIQDETLDLVTSQFGVEYAGSEALAEAARVTAPGGIFAAVLHLRDGAIYRECATNLDAIQCIRASKLLNCFEDIFHAALAVQQGQSDKERFHSTDRVFARSVAEAENVFRRWGQGVADGLLFRLYTDIAHMYRRFNHYEPEEVFSWIKLMSRELESYAGRMESMLQAALAGPDFDRIIAQLVSSHFTVHEREILYMGRLSVPAAWTVVAEKATSNK